MIERLRVRIPAGVAGEFSSPELTFCAHSYSVFVPTVIVRKSPLSFCQQCRWKVTPKHASALDPAKLEGANTGHSVGTYRQGEELTRISSENTRPQSSHHAEPLCSDSGLMSEIGVRADPH